MSELKKKLTLLLFIFGILFNTNYCISEIESEEALQKTLNIAIVSSSPDGILASYYLNKKFENNKKVKLNVTIFEKEPIFAKGIYSHTYNDKTVDLGVAPIYDWYLNIKQLVKDYEMNLTPMISPNTLHRTAFFNGEEFTLNSLTNETISQFRNRYKEDFMVIVQLLKQFQNDFQKINESVEKNPKKSIEELLKDCGLDQILLKKRTDEFLSSLGLKMSTIDDLVRTALFSSTSMNTEAHIYSGLRNMFSFFTSKFTIKEGVVELLRKILFDEKYFNKNSFLRLETKVEKVKFLKNDGRYLVTSQDLNSKKYNEEKFDKVIFANLLKNDIKFENFDDLEKIERNFITNKQMVSIYTYSVIGNVDMSTPLKNKNETLYTNSNGEKLNDPDQSADVILVNDLRGFDKFMSIMNICKNCILNRNYEKSGRRMNSFYKIRSSKNLTKEDLGKYFLDGFIFKTQSDYLSKEIKFKALPSESNENILDIMLDDKGLYFMKSYQTLDDNLEYPAVFAKNIANLIYKEYIGAEGSYFEFEL